MSILEQIQHDKIIL